jgi:hypothetical protein
MMNHQFWSTCSSMGTFQNVVNFPPLLEQRFGSPLIGFLSPCIVGESSFSIVRDIQAAVNFFLAHTIDVSARTSLWTPHENHASAMTSVTDAGSSNCPGRFRDADNIGARVSEESRLDEAQRYGPQQERNKKQPSEAVGTVGGPGATDHVIGQCQVGRVS